MREVRGGEGSEEHFLRCAAVVLYHHLKTGLMPVGAQESPALLKKEKRVMKIPLC